MFEALVLSFFNWELLLFNLLIVMVWSLNVRFPLFGLLFDEMWEFEERSLKFVLCKI